MDRPAKDIAQELLDRTGTGLMTDDFVLFETAFHIPHEVGTFSGVRRLSTREELESVFRDMAAFYRAQGVTDLVRYVLAASHVRPDRIESTHIANVMVRSQRLGDSYAVYSVIERIGGRWVLTSSDYAVDPKSGQARILAARGIPEPPRPRDTRRPAGGAA